MQVQELRLRKTIDHGPLVLRESVASARTTGLTPTTRAIRGQTMSARNGATSATRRTRDISTMDQWSPPWPLSGTRIPRISLPDEMAEVRPVQSGPGAAPLHRASRAAALLHAIKPRPTPQSASCSWTASHHAQLDAGAPTPLRIPSSVPCSRSCPLRERVRSLGRPVVHAPMPAPGDGTMLILRGAQHDRYRRRGRRGRS